ncbi:MAG: hypothetical protein E6901_08730, partial [Cutibacterium granulosum]|nr:hypothetical protein [Cutibacterium granulosum]
DCRPAARGAGHCGRKRRIVLASGRMSPEAMSKRNIPEAMRNRVGLPAGRIVTVSGTVCVERWEPAAW